MSARRPATAALPCTLALVCLLALGGCGPSASDAARATVRQFDRFLQKRQYASICKHVLAPALSAQLTAPGLTCAEAIRAGFAGATIGVGTVKVKGSSATVSTLTVVQGQASIETMGVANTGAGWRVTSLTAPTTTNGGAATTLNGASATTTTGAASTSTGSTSGGG